MLVSLLPKCTPIHPAATFFVLKRHPFGKTNRDKIRCFILSMLVEDRVQILHPVYNLLHTTITPSIPSPPRFSIWLPKEFPQNLCRDGVLAKVMGIVAFVLKSKLHLEIVLLQLSWGLLQSRNFVLNILNTPENF